MTLFKKLFDKWKAQSLSGKLYTAGNGLLMLVAGALMLVPRTMTHTVTLFATGPLLLFMAGFLIWIVPKLLAIGRSQVGTVPLIVVSAVLAPLCLGWARQCIGAAMQLPPQSFDVTVALLTVLLIPLAWAAVVALILLLVFIVSMFSSVTIRTLGQSVGSFVSPAAGRIPQMLEKVDLVEREAFYHGLGALASAVVIALLFMFYSKAVLNPAAIRLAAYGLDFSQADKYPGIEPGQRIRLLDNGYVAYAERHGFEVQFDVKPLAPADKTK
ncbi:hypothetical protein WJH60_28615 [Burkholderia orbicola]|uniref:hypothetical protein n=1 Tax=Burkholderia cepacia complex TaxID=87882 RepID=UPI00158C1050|nr:hypothetical protein [Burkholderia cenocepacia]